MTTVVLKFNEHLFCSYSEYTQIINTSPDMLMNSFIHTIMFILCDNAMR